MSVDRWSVLSDSVNWYSLSFDKLMDWVYQLIDGWNVSAEWWVDFVPCCSPANISTEDPSVSPMLRDCHAQLSFDDTDEGMKRGRDIVASGKPSIALEEVRVFCQLKNRQQTNQLKFWRTHHRSYAGRAMYLLWCMWLAGPSRVLYRGDMFLSQHVVIVINVLCKSILTTFQDKQNIFILF